MGRVKKAINPILLSEHQEQCLLFSMIELHSNKYPALKFAFAVPNGGLRPNKTRVNKSGATVRFSVEAQKLKRSGAKPGVPDLFIPIPRYKFIEIKQYSGLFIEMKIRGNKPTDNQLAYIEYLTSAGYQCNVCYSADEAMKVILDYLK